MVRQIMKVDLVDDDRFDDHTCFDESSGEDLGKGTRGKMPRGSFFFVADRRLKGRKVYFKCKCMLWC